MKEIADTREFPLFIQWLSDSHSSQHGTPLARIEKIVLADKDEMSDSWFKHDILGALGDVKIEWVYPEVYDTQSGLVEAHLSTPNGQIALDQKSMTHSG